MTDNSLSPSFQTLVQNLKKNDGLSDYKGNANMSMPIGNDRMGDKIDKINGLEINEDSNVSSKVAQNNPLKDYRNIGDIVQCATEGCTNTFQVRTTWHKYCPECRAKKDLPFAKRKGRK